MDHDADFRIRWEWEPGQSVRAPEHHATWARIQILLNTDCVTLVEDRASGSSRRSIYAPLYPLAEWIAYNWWFLIAHSRPGRLETNEPTRHSLRAAGDGFVWPNLEIFPRGGRLATLSWRRDAAFAGSAPIRYLTSGDATVDSDTMQQTLVHVVTSVLERLRDQGVNGTPLEKEWESINSLDTEELEFCIAAAQLGLDPLSESEEHESAIIGAADQLPKSLLGDFFDAVHTEQILPAIEWITAATADAGAVIGGANATIRELREELNLPNLSATIPYQLGWKQAHAIRNALQLDPESRFDIHEYTTDLYRPGVDSSLQAVGVSPSDALPAVVLGRHLGLNGMRFILSRALWNRLATPEPSFLITAAHTEHQRIERAFAAELLAPAVGISARLDVPPQEAVQEDLGIVAEHFGVSTILVEHQIDSQILGTGLD